jgi:hypothetical protein
LPQFLLGPFERALRVALVEFAALHRVRC